MSAAAAAAALAPFLAYLPLSHLLGNKASHKLTHFYSRHLCKKTLMHKWN
jgi:hypothetical protein